MAAATGATMARTTLGRLWEVLRLTVEGFVADDAWSRGASIAYFTLFGWERGRFRSVLRAIEWWKQRRQTAMKRGVLAFTVTMSAVSVAGAFAAMPLWLLRSGEPAGSVPATPSLEARQAPVPLLRKPQRTFEVWPLAEAIGPLRSAADDTTSKAAAKAAIEADGYKNASILHKGTDGLWRGEGLRGDTKVLLIVDAQGNVAME